MITGMVDDMDLKLRFGTDPIVEEENRRTDHNGFKIRCRLIGSWCAINELDVKTNFFLVINLEQW